MKKLDADDVKDRPTAALKNQRSQALETSCSLALKARIRSFS